MALRPCIVCSSLTSGSRCVTHRREQERAHTRAKRAKRPLTAAEIKRRRDAVDAHRARYGNWCPGWRCPPHASADLTADHVRAVAQGGAEDGPLEVLCRGCNGRKSDRE